MKVQRNMDDSTRDIAVATAAEMKAHVVDCLEVRIRNERKLDKISDKLDNVVKNVALIIGGLIMLSRMPDWLPEIIAHLNK